MFPNRIITVSKRINAFSFVSEYCDGYGWVLFFKLIYIFKLIPSIFKVFSFSFNFLSILCESFSEGFNALRTHHRKHLLYLLFMLIIAFLSANSLGNGIHVSPHRWVYIVVCNSNLIILYNLHPLPIDLKVAIFSNILSVIII